MNWVYRCLIIEDSQVQFARELSAVVAGSSGEGMYTTPLSPLSPDGAQPPTHWVSAGLISDQFAALLPLTTYPTDAEPIHRPGKPEIVAHIATEKGYQTTAEAVAALLDVADVTEQDAQQAMQRLGIQMVQPTEPTNGE